MSYDIGPKIGIDGEAEFRKAITGLNTSLKTMSTEMGVVTSAYSRNANTEEALTEKSRVLNEQINAQKEKLSQLKSMLSQSAEKYGAADEKTQKWQQAVNNATSDLNKMEGELKDNSKYLNEAKSSSDGCAKSIDKYGKQVSDAKEKTNVFGEVLKANLVSQAIIEGVKALASGVKQLAQSIGPVITDVADYGSNINDMSEKIGISAESYQKWDYVMSLCGESVDSLKMGMKTLSTQAQNGSTAFQELGISQQEVASMSKEDLLQKTIEGLASMEDGTKRTALATQLLGKSGADMGSLLNQGTKSIQDQMDMAEKYGLIMSDEAVAASDNFGDSLDTLKGTMTGLKNRMVVEFLPSLTQVTDGLALLFTGDTSGLDMIDTGIQQLSANLAAAIPAALDTGKSILESIASAILDNLPSLINTGITIISALSSDIISALPQLIQTAADIIVSLAGGISENLPAMIPAIVDVVLQIVETLTDNVDKLVDASIAIITGLAEGLIAALPVLIEKAPEIVGKLIKAIVENTPKLADAALEIVVELAKAIITNLPQLVSSAAEIVSTIVKGITDLITDFIDIGDKIVKGIWKGISDGYTWIIGKIKGWVGNLVDFCKSILGIHSPSTVFAGIGGYMAQGMGNGFVSAMSGVKDQMQRSIPIPSVDLSRITGSVSNSGNTGTAASASSTPQPITINFTGDLAQLVRVLKPVLDEENVRVGSTLVVTGG